MPKFAHALTIGGTGMLVRASAYLAERSRALTLLARHPTRANIDAASVHSVSCDYRDTGALANALAEACARAGPIEIALTWIHGDPRPVMEIIASHLNLTSARVIRVVGSAFASPEREGRDQSFMRETSNLTRQTVILGFVIEPGGSRWLRNDEISAAAIDAIASPDREIAIAGTLTPWSQRP